MLLYIPITIFGILLVWHTIKRLPGDIIEMHYNYRTKNWSEFWVVTGIAGIYWGLSALVIWFFFVPIVPMIIRGLIGFINLLMGFRV